ncbi:MAG: hypothetical protein GX607_02915 [Myxococcales bacterium]|nr:hypothetical protein [Myxococcales bacterium]
MDRNRVRLGELLVGAKIITPEQLEEVLALQASDKRRLGALLVASGYVTETQVTQVLSQQLSVPWVSLHHIDFSRQLLNLVRRELAERHCLIPIYVRRSRHQKDTLYVAMDDPTDLEARAEVELYAGLPVRPMIAPPSEIRSAIRVYYGGQPPPVPARPASAQMAVAPEQVAVPSGEPQGADPTQGRAAVLDGSAAPSPAAPSPAAPSPAAPSPAAPGAPRVASEPPTAQAPSTPAPPDAEARGPSQAPPSPEEAAPFSDDEPKSSPMASREPSMPAPPADDGAKMVTLTLLDGTQLILPAAAGRVSRPEGTADMTAGDLVAALRAHASGADTSAVLGSEINWQRVCAALLSILLRKQLIADWEFVDELRR